MPKGKTVFRDPILAALHARVEREVGPVILHPPQAPEQYFERLTGSIVSQQLSTKVAEVIFARVRALAGEEFSPARLLMVSVEDLRQAGMSYSKAAYVHNIARAWTDGLVDPHRLEQLDNQAVIETLTQIKGVGQWTAEMFLMFTLGRPDVFSVGDYGLRKAISLAYDISLESKPAVFVTLAEQWSPHRTLACRVLWESLELKSQ